MNSLVDSGYGSEDNEDGDLELASAITLPATSSVMAPSHSSSITEGQAEGQMRHQSSSAQASSSTRVILVDVCELFGDTETAAAVHQRKRHAVNGSGEHPMPHIKLPRGTLQPSRIPPDTAGGLLTPPQLRGRSNVATEDLDKIFVRRLKR